ncbi:DegV family protein [Phosphitispora fastidiosa]|uniref:DegV family protein n=1 Tax=Phosphitispora fastidiosa TaxID=2837202 RepID=UPI001E3B6A43|nr:DegV family protein [Phosphitispora fastidiosa]MBU7005512.1 DegV family protein with EDD domain [Phosphitispora fastidiosa]
MGNVRIVTDSTADLPQELVEALDIVVVPLKVSFGKDIYRDGVDISSDEFISRLKKEDYLPVTSQPSPGEFVAIYEQLTSKGDSIISIHISSQLSGTVQSAKTAKAMVDSRGVYVVDSCSASMGLGLIVLAAAKAARNGAAVRQILDIVNERVDKGFIIFMVGTLEYLEKGGRIGKANSFVGSLLKIKPILTLNDGVVVPLEKVRGEGRAIKRMAEIVRDMTEGSKKYSSSLVYGSNYASLMRLREKIVPGSNLQTPIIAKLGPVIMSHTGPEVIGIAVCPE